MEHYTPGVCYSAGNLMLKWTVLDQHINNIEVGDTANVYINFESIIRNLFTQKNLNSLISFYKQNVVIELESAILNLVANYRMYFNKRKCKTKIYLYNTNMTTDNQQMKLVNKYYREYYHNQYMVNPMFKPMGELLNNIIIPEIKLILSYVTDCYYIETNTFDGSIIPQIICDNISDGKNIIITSDVFDTLYMFNPLFKVIYIKRHYSNMRVISTIEETVQNIVKDENPFDLTIFNSELYFRLLLSIKGSKIRNIKSAKGFGYIKFLNLIKDGIDNGHMLSEFNSIESIIDLFPKKYCDDIKIAFKCTSIETQCQLLNESDIDYIKNQIIDKSDISSLEALNNKRFLDNPINLQGLLN